MNDAWCGVLGHGRIVDRLRRVDAASRWAAAYLLVGPAGVGKYAFARAAAKTLLCSRRDETFVACGACASCHEFDGGAHPDFTEVAKPPGRASIPLDLLVGPPEKRMQEGLCHWIGLRPTRGRRKVAVLDDADLLNEEGANSLLKTLEEPPPGSVIFLISHSAERQLPTIRSRSQILRFQPLDQDVVGRICLAQGWAEDETSAAALAARSGGSLKTAHTLAGGDAGTELDEFVREFAGGAFDPFALARRAIAFAEGAGKEPARRRDRLRLLLDVTSDLLHGAIRVSAGAPSATLGADRLVAATGDGPDSLLDALDRTIAAAGHIDRNANQATTLECWLDDVARLLRGEVVVDS